jgi:hypothetical protein
VFKHLQTIIVERNAYGYLVNFECRFKVSYSTKNRHLQRRCSAVSPWLSTFTVPQGKLGITPYIDANELNRLINEITCNHRWSQPKPHLNITAPFPPMNLQDEQRFISSRLVDRLID